MLGVALVASCGGHPPDPLVASAADALGGAAAIESSPTLVLEGDGEAYYLGENRAPDTDLPVFETRFRWAFDWGHRRFRKEELRLPMFLTGSSGLRQTIAALDGDVAYDIGADERARRSEDGVAANRRAEWLHHPLGLLRAALAPGAAIHVLPAQDGREHADITTADGLVESLAVDGRTKLPLSIASAIAHPILGDVVEETTFDAYAPVGPLLLPTRITERIDGKVVARVHAISQTLNVDPDRSLPPAAFRAFSENARLAAPPALAAEPPQAPARLAVERLAPGVWRLGAARYWSVLVEFADHFALVEAPLDDARTEALLAAANALGPGKPVTQVVVTHHHFDHIGGVRAAIASGLTVFVRGGLDAHAAPTAARSAASRDAADLVAELAARPHARAPDLLQRRARAPSIVRVDHELAIKDATRELVLLPIVGSGYAETLLMAYLPGERLLVEADVYSPPEAGARGEASPFAANLLENIRQRRLRVDRVVPLHGPVVPLRDLEDAARASALPAAPSPSISPQ